MILETVKKISYSVDAYKMFISIIFKSGTLIVTVQTACKSDGKQYCL